MACFHIYGVRRRFPSYTLTRFHFFTLQRAIRLTENLQLRTDNFSHPANLAAKNNTNIPKIIR